MPEGVKDAARGMGMTPAQVFRRVELPLALPVWLSGVRQAAVMLVGGRRFVPWLLDQAARTGSRELFTPWMLSGSAMIWLSVIIGSSAE